MKSDEQAHGRLVAKALSGAWRQTPPLPDVSDVELDAVAPLLYGSGAAALGWWRIRESELGTTPAARTLQQAYRLQTLEAGRHERDIKQVFALLRSAGVEPMLIKGWAIARLYPEKGLRPYGDIDLLVRPAQYKNAAAVLKSAEGSRYFVDLQHEEFAGLDDRSVDELYARSQLVKLGEVDVRVLAPEDHLRLLCIHLLRHGAFRPLWLCDIALAVESRPANFDWADCLGRNRRQRDWVACTIGLAHQLLGAEVADTPIAERARHLPAWLVPTVLKQWETPCIVDHLPPELIMISLRHPSRMLKALCERWPDPIQATIRMRGAFNEMPRLPFQLGNYITQTANFLRRLPELLNG